MSYCIRIIFLGLLFFPSTIYAAEQTKVKTEVSEVKLHLAGAEVTRKALIRLAPGRNHFVFTQLSSKLYPQTIQVSCTNDLVNILSVTSKTNFLEKTKEDQRIGVLRDSLLIVRNKIGSLSDERNSYEEERELLRQNRQFKGNDKTLSVAELKQAADFYRQRSHEINKTVSRLERKLVKANRRLFDLKLQLNELNAGAEPTSEIELVLESGRALETELELRFVVRDAGWAAIYDLQAGEFNAPINLKYRALAFNNTGIDWNNVDLTLSTADPLQSASQPGLMTWNLNDYSTTQINSIANLNITNNGDISQQTQTFTLYNQIVTDKTRQTAEVQKVLGEEFNQEIDYNTDLFRRMQAERANAPQLNRARLDVPEFNVDFPIDKPYTVPSDKKPYSIDIEKHKLDVTYKYFAVPKMDKDAFLLAQIVGWEDLNLVSGPVNIYKGKKYIGQSNLDIRNLSDTLEVSLGRDKDVVVTRVKIKGKTRKQVLGTTKKASVAYNISARNNHSGPIDLEIQDQVPISNDREVIVTVDELSGAEFEEKIGVLSWKFSIQPAETKTMEFGFTIKYPKDKTVNVQYNKSRSMEQMRYF